MKVLVLPGSLKVVYKVMSCRPTDIEAEQDLQTSSDGPLRKLGLAEDNLALNLRWFFLSSSFSGAEKEPPSAIDAIRDVKDCWQLSHWPLCGLEVTQRQRWQRSSRQSAGQVGPVSFLSPGFPLSAESIPRRQTHSRELCSILGHNLNGKRIWKRIDVCICINESLCWTPETNITLLTNCTPI